MLVLIIVGVEVVVDSPRLRAERRRTAGQVWWARPDMVGHAMGLHLHVHIQRVAVVGWSPDPVSPQLNIVGRGGCVLQLPIKNQSDQRGPTGNSCFHIVGHTFVLPSLPFPSAVPPRF